MLWLHSNVSSYYNYSSNVKLTFGNKEIFHPFVPHGACEWIKDALTVTGP